MTVEVDVTSPTSVTVDTTEGVTIGAFQAERNARIAADALLIPLAQKGAASGVATLDGAGTIPDAQIPASIARDAEVSTAVAALVAAAPGTLDTLNELAAALADDPNFATTITTLLAGKQPLDGDLTAIAALTTTTYGRSLLELANAVAARTALGLGTAATANTGDFDTAGAAAAAQAASQPVDGDLTAIAALSTTVFGRALLALADGAALRTAAGLGTAATANVGDFDPAGAATAAAAALVNSSPATLDTLKELADALGDDPNFATTTATALGTKVPIAAAALPGTQPNEYFVSTGSKASDSNSGDKYSPFATLAHAIAVAEAATGAYVIRLGYGTFQISAADSNGNGVTMTKAGSKIEGAGEVLTTINIAASGLIWGVLLTAQCQLKGVTFTFTSNITAPYWVTGVTCAAGGHAESARFEDVWVTYKNALTMPTIPAGTSTQPSAAFALGPDLPGEGSMDIAGTLFLRCVVIGGSQITQAAGFQFSNGTSENVTSNTLMECTVAQMRYGISLSGSGCRWFGGGFTSIGNFDIWITHSPGEEVVFVGCRGEDGNVVLNATNVFGDCIVILIGHHGGNYKTSGLTAGEIIRFNTQGTLILTGGTFWTGPGFANAGLTKIALNTASNTQGPPLLICHGATFDNASPFPAQDVVHYRRMIFGTKLFNLTTNVITPNAAWQAVVDGAATPITFASPATPAATTSTTFVMAGLAVAFTPITTGKVLVRITGQAWNAVTNAGLHVEGCYGTGAAPANGATVTGTVFPSGDLTLRSVTATGPSNTFDVIGLISGLTVGTAYWFDLAFRTTNAADSANVSNLSVTVQECQ